jgi:MoaA/NifB/PqqE/SkfB family radical SAM enzyme
MDDFEQAFAAYRRTVQAVPGEPICHAPFVNVHFSHGGEVLACCHNRTYTLGTYPAETVSEIWAGEKVQELRRSMVRNDMSKGCQPCLRQLLARDFTGLADMAGSYRQQWFSDNWQAFQANGADPGRFPRSPFMLEFELHNSCNLQCVMCHGVASSSIRKYRDALPPLPTPYDTAFVDQLAGILPHVFVAGFTGGEPFLIPIYYEIWDRIAQCNPKMMLLLVTNGTMLNDRIKGLVESLNFVINVSMDSIVKETYESIRIGSNFDLVMNNSLYFADLMQKQGKPFIWRCCAMRQNWRELPEMVRFCDAHGIRVIFNQVEYPLDCSLTTLPPSELEEVARFLMAADTFEASTPVQTFNHEQYRGLVQRIASSVTPETWKHSLLDRLENARHNPMLNDVSVRGARLSTHASADALAEKVSTYIATQLTIDQAIEAAGDGMVSEVAWDSLTEQRRDIAQFRTLVPLDVFARVFLNVSLRTYVKIRGVRADHSVQAYSRIDPLVQFIDQQVDRDAIVDGLFACPPADIYAQVSRGVPGDIDSLLKRAAATQEANA